jgi:hypothetical protein
MNRLGQVIGVILALALVVAAITGIGYLFALAINQGATVAAALLAASATVFGAAVVRYGERRRIMEAIRREHLGALYLELASVLTGHEIPARKRDKIILDFLRKSLVYASPKTLETFREWRYALPDVEPWPEGAIKANSLRYEKFIKAMRRDLGISNWMLQEGDLSRTVLSDFDEL